MHVHNTLLKKSLSYSFDGIFGGGITLTRFLLAHMTIIVRMKTALLSTDAASSDSTIDEVALSLIL